jgi:hypothetical protein
MSLVKGRILKWVSYGYRIPLLKSLEAAVIHIWSVKFSLQSWTVKVLFCVSITFGSCSCYQVYKLQSQRHAVAVEECTTTWKRNSAYIFHVVYIFYTAATNLLFYLTWY